MDQTAHIVDDVSDLLNEDKTDTKDVRRRSASKPGRSGIRAWKAARSAKGDAGLVGHALPA
jgi:hypothetical protein